MNANDTGAETPVPDSPAGHISSISIKQLMYSGWTGKLICEYQPWFGTSNHKSVGYNENSSATVAAQDSFMITEGCDVNLIDFYGSLDPNQSFNLATTNAVFADLNSRSGYPLSFGIMEDKNALISSCPSSNQTESATLTCLENTLVADMDYVNTHYANSSVYFKDAGNPVIFSFVTQSVWPILTSTDWNSIWSTVKAHTDTYAAPFKYIFEFGSFTAASYDSGRYGWVQPPTYSSTQQFWWGSSTSSSPTYLDNLYSAGLAHPSQLTVGALWKGFDDNNASWSGNRVIAQQCGQVLLKTASEISKFFGGSNPQIPYVQVVTWNDYEEGTAVEAGIDNCYTVDASLSGDQLTWSLVASDSTYASSATIHHFNVYYADAGGNLYLAASNLPVTTSTLDLSSLVPTGTWTVYVEMAGQPLIIDRMSNGVTFVQGTSAAASLSPSSLNFSNQTVGTTSAGQKITLSNVGSGTMTVSGVSTTGDFIEANNCPTSLAATGSCTIAVTFSPTATGTRTGSLQVSESADATPKIASLSGTGMAPAISFAPAGLAFAAQVLNTTSSAQSVALANMGTGTLNITGFAVAGDFALVSNTCSGAIAVSSSCSLSIAFTPSSPGGRSGSVVVTSNAPGMNVITLIGSGADFSVSASPGLQAVAAGGSATYTISVPSAGAAFAKAISLRCAGLPANASCTFSPISLSADNSSNLTVATKATQRVEFRPTTLPAGNPLFATWLPSGGMGLAGLLFAADLRKRKRGAKWVVFAVVLLLLLGIAFGCGGSRSAINNTTIPGTPAGTYSITVIGSSDTLTHSTMLTLTVK